MLHFWSWLLLVATVWFQELFVISSLRSSYWFLAPCILYCVVSLDIFQLFTPQHLSYGISEEKADCKIFLKTSKLAVLSPWDCQKRVESHENYNRKAKLHWLLWKALQTVSNNTSLIAAYLIWSHSLLFSVEVNLTVLLFLLAGQKALKKSTVICNYVLSCPCASIALLYLIFW